MRHNNLLIALVLYIILSSSISLCSEPKKPAPSWWHTARIYMTSWMPQYIKNKISYLTTPTKQIGSSNPTKDYLEITVTERLISILKNGKEKKYPLIKQMNALINSTFDVAQEYSLDAESIINSSINTVMDNINPKTMQQDLNLFTNMKEFMLNKLQEKKEFYTPSTSSFKKN